MPKIKNKKKKSSNVLKFSFTETLNVTYEEFGARDLVLKKKWSKKPILTMAKLPSLVQLCSQNNTWILRCYIFLADSMRFEAAPSSKDAIFGLWIGPNSARGWRKLLWLVAKKKEM